MITDSVREKCKVLPATEPCCPLDHFDRPGGGAVYSAVFTRSRIRNAQGSCSPAWPSSTVILVAVRACVFQAHISTAEAWLHNIRTATVTHRAISRTAQVPEPCGRSSIADREQPDRYANSPGFHWTVDDTEAEHICGRVLDVFASDPFSRLTVPVKQQKRRFQRFES